MQIIINLLRFPERFNKNKKLSDILNETQKRILLIAIIHEMLYKSNNFLQISFSDYIQELIKVIFSSYNTKNIKLLTQIDDVLFDINTAIPCGLIINELVANSFKHVFKNEAKGKIIIRITRSEDNEITILVSDNGIGFSKEITIDNVNTNGLYLTKILVENQLNGTINFFRDNYTNFVIKFHLEKSGDNK